MAEVHFKKAEGKFTATITQEDLSVQISFQADDSADEAKMEEAVKLLYTNLAVLWGGDEAARVFAKLSEQMAK
jgi:hypothetical protein